MSLRSGAIICKYNDGDLIQYKYPEKYKEFTLKSFLINNGYKYIILSKRNDGIHYYLDNILVIINKDENYKEYKLNNTSTVGFKKYVNSGNVYFLDSESHLYKIENDSMLTSITLPVTNPSECYDFVVIDNSVYYAYSSFTKNVFCKYDILKKLNTDIPMINDGYVPNNMAVYKNMIIGTQTNCITGRNGVIVYKYK